MATAGAVADVDTNASEGFLQGILDSLVSNPASLVSVLQATVTTIRGAHVSSDDPARGYTVDGAYESKDDKGNTTTKYALNAGGFAGSLQAAILGDKDSAKGTGSEADPNNDPASLTVTGCALLKAGNTPVASLALLIYPASLPSAAARPAISRIPTCCSNCSRSATWACSKHSAPSSMTVRSTV